jgi:hypothetical protein
VVTSSPKRSVISFRCTHAAAASRESAGHGLELVLPTEVV